MKKKILSDNDPNHSFMVTVLTENVDDQSAKPEQMSLF